MVHSYSKGTLKSLIVVIDAKTILQKNNFFNEKLLKTSLNMRTITYQLDWQLSSTLLIVLSSTNIIK